MIAMVKSNLDSPGAALARMRAASLSPERRREIAVKASRAAAEARKRASDVGRTEEPKTGAVPSAVASGDDGKPAARRQR